MMCARGDSCTCSRCRRDRLSVASCIGSKRIVRTPQSVRSSEKTPCADDLTRVLEHARDVAKFMQTPQAGKEMVSATSNGGTEPATPANTQDHSPPPAQAPGAVEEEGEEGELEVVDSGAGAAAAAAAVATECESGDEPGGSIDACEPEEIAAVVRASTGSRWGSAVMWTAWVVMALLWLALYAAMSDNAGSGRRGRVTL